MVVKLYIDYREKRLGELLTVPYEFKNLLVGDIQFLVDETIQIVIERKSIKDLNSSIGDGRYHEQKSRLCGLFDRNRIAYIIEGEILNDPFLDKNKLYSAILHTTWRDNIHVIKTFSIKDTSDYISELYKRLDTKTEDWLEFLKCSKAEYATNPDKKVYSKKGENNTWDVSYVNMLAQVPGCSTKISEEISKVYPNMNQLIEAYRKNADLLKDHKVGSRKIGPVLNKRIYSYLFGITTDS